jgi:hypothetical protein
MLLEQMLLLLLLLQKRLPACLCAVPAQKEASQAADKHQNDNICKRNVTA